MRNLCFLRPVRGRDSSAWRRRPHSRRTRTAARLFGLGAAAAALLLGSARPLPAVQAPEPSSYEVPAPPAAPPAQVRLSGADLRPATRIGALPPPAVGAARLAGADPAAHPVASASAAWAAEAGLDVELLATDVVETPAVLYARFRQGYRGRPILGTSAIFQWDRQGRLALLRSSLQPSEAMPLPEAVEKLFAVTPEAAREAFLRDLPSAAAASGSGSPAGSPGVEAVPHGNDAPDESGKAEGRPEDGAAAWEAVEEAWLPEPDGAGGIRLRPVWRLRARTESPPGRWEGLVDAARGTLLARRDVTAWATLSGRVQAMVEPATPGDESLLLPVPRAAITVTAGTWVGQDTTDGEGRFQLELPQAGPGRTLFELKGPYAWLRDVSRDLYTPVDTLTAIAPGNLSLRWDDANSTFAQRDAFYHVARAREFVRALDPGPALEPLDRQLQVRVDDPSGGCNAYWSGTRINFYAEGSGCVSSARIADVVYHEYGHAVSEYCYEPYPIPGDMNEGFSDYFATSLTNQPNIGNGFYGPGTRIREVERDRVWPRDASPSIHLQGLILAGALWDLRKELGAARTDALFHYARYGAAQSMDDYLLDLLVQDDDDGDLDNGTPDFAAIIRAFRAHGIGDYAVHIAHAPLPDLEDPPPQIEVSARIRSLLGLAPDSLALYWSAGDEFAFTRQSPEPGPGAREFRARIPAPPAGTTVRYYWAAADTSGNRASLPAGAPDECFEFHVGADTEPPEIFHEPLEFVTEEAELVTLRARATDNSGAIAAAAVRLRRPAGDTTRVELLPLESAIEHRAEIPLPALVEGEAFAYVLEATDGARTPNRRTWPEDGEVRVEVRRGVTHRFESGDGGLLPEAGWAHGIPAEGTSAWSGERVWAVGLSGVYEDNLSASLLFGPLDLRGWDRARLEFRHLFRTEAAYDGGLIELSADPLGPWFPLTPEGGYPFEKVAALEGAGGYSGDSQGWRAARVPLDQALGTVRWVRFRFESDARVTDLGWLLDDLALVGAQARAPAAGFSARECGADCLDLRWSAPAGIDTASLRFHGYELRRLAETDSAEEVLVFSEGRRPVFRDTGLPTGVTQRYRLTALYDEGKSAAVEARAAPFAPSLSLDAEEIVYELRSVPRSDTILSVANRTGGTLRFNAYVADSASGIDDVRLRCRQGDGEAWRRLWAGQGGAAGPDPELIEVAARSRFDAEIGPVLELRLRGRSAWGDPRTDWGGLVWIDVDDNLGTGRAHRNLGADLLLAFGRAAQDAGHDGPAVLLDPALRPTWGLTGASLPAGADSLLLSVPWRLLGEQGEVRLVVTLARGLAEAPFAEAPVPASVPWLDREPRFGRAYRDDPQPLEVVFDVSASGSGTYRGALLLETNDAARPVLRIPVLLRARGIIPEDISDLRFGSEESGIRVEFRLPADPVPLGVVVERADRDIPVWRARTPEPMLPDSSGWFRFLDAEVEPGAEYLYRFRTLFAPQTFVLFGPYEAKYEPEAPARLALWPVRPNPLRSGGDAAILRVDLPRGSPVRLDVFDAAGRHVRSLVDGTLPAGAHRIRWDGRDGGGRSLPSGSYWLRLWTREGRRSVRAVIVR